MAAGLRFVKGKGKTVEYEVADTVLTRICERKRKNTKVDVLQILGGCTKRILIKDKIV